MTTLLQQARHQGIEVSDINTVLLVGGTVQLPAVQTWVIPFHFKVDTFRLAREQGMRGSRGSK